MGRCLLSPRGEFPETLVVIGAGVKRTQPAKEFTTASFCDDVLRALSRILLLIRDLEKLLLSYKEEVTGI